jgi:hypothetical protein
MPVKFRTCQLFDNSLATHSKVVDKLKAFMTSKSQNPIAPFGGNDKPFIAAGPISSIMPGLKHAHLTSDISVVYRLHGDNPKILDLFIIASHAELGTGQPSNVKKQKHIAVKFSNQQFK